MSPVAKSATSKPFGTLGFALFGAGTTLGPLNADGVAKSGGRSAIVIWWRTPGASDCQSPAFPWPFRTSLWPILKPPRTIAAATATVRYTTGPSRLAGTASFGRFRRSPSVLRIPDSYDSHGDSVAGVPRGLASIVGLGVHHDTPSDDRTQFPGERNVIHDKLEGGVAAGIGLEISEIASVPDLLIRQGMLVTQRIVMIAGALSVFRGSGPRTGGYEWHAWSSEAARSVARRLPLCLCLRV